MESLQDRQPIASGSGGNVEHGLDVAVIHDAQNGVRLEVIEVIVEVDHGEARSVHLMRGHTQHRARREIDEPKVGFRPHIHQAGEVNGV
ncbi:MAG TPA: hypothetical protein VG672_22715 [Bryobacteraceae bacterium]|nr:hypothetical protein [Bryobacteraceae bacterium]